MNRGDYFLAVLQTLTIKQLSVTPMKAVLIMDAAGNLPEEAIGTERPAIAAQQFFVWQLGEHGLDRKVAKPAWLLAWEECVSERVVVRTNPQADNGAQTWWLYAESAFSALLADSEKLPFPRELAELVVGRLRMAETNSKGARQFRAWVETVPGCEQEPFIYEGLDPS